MDTEYPPIDLQREVFGICREDSWEVLDVLINQSSILVSTKIQVRNRSCFSCIHDTNETSFVAVTPLHVAATWGSWQCIKVLLNYGAQINFHLDDPSFYDYQPLYLAVSNAYMYNMLNKDLRYVKSVRLLLEAGAVVEYAGITSARGSLLNMVVGWNFDAEIVEFLIKYGANIKKADDLDRTALHYAAMFDRDAHHQHVLTLLKYDPDINKQDVHGNTALSYAAFRSTVNAVQALCENGADPNIKSAKAMTPLHYACRHGKTAVINYLKTVVEDINCTNHDGDTPLDLAIRNLSVFAKCLDLAEPDSEQVKSVYLCFQGLLNYGAVMEDFSGATLESVLVRSQATHLIDVVALLVNSQPYIDLRNVVVQLPSDIAYDAVLFYQTLLSLGSQPRKLQHLCRCSIRNYLGKRCHIVVNYLPLPVHLKRYILLDYRTLDFI
ncbi:ankyrin repeat and SOCS box protein 16-like [Saccoglossus kowalevskii]|uniref:Ankyrin repeat and SOCS box protein 10-like n=1 Tax=Saccoglossus kowalevskii TaxID=10224 RepID=A0ABM0MRZ1_SACKO|nr:PREDICTED: ankyrin repeat and SOCS box protein 10-like [Saccoglossus kowalevskii]